MVLSKSLDEIKLITALLRDIHMSRSEVFDQRALRLTAAKAESRITQEGLSFLTKTLPRLGKALDRALSGEVILDASELAFKSKQNSKLPIFMGELFQLVFSHDGMVLTNPCVTSIKQLRQICYLFYKYKLPYSAKQEQDVLDSFLKTEEDIAPYDKLFNGIADRYDKCHDESAAGYHECDKPCGSDCPSGQYRLVPPFSTSIGRIVEGTTPLGEIGPYYSSIIRRAKRLLSRLFQTFDPLDIHPKHGPGSVSTRERLWDKYTFRTIPERIATLYPIDAYYYASLGHVCDAMRELASLGGRENPARILFVPKDSRGPRLISCEPLEFQWIQQGLGGAIVRHVERNAITKHNVHFTDQQPNQLGALLGSSSGSYATLDLKEASDRVSVGLVRLLFPSKVLPYLVGCRSLATTLPDGTVLNLRKFAPMGSALCFPILALTAWAIVTAGMSDADSREGVLVYGDDVIVPTAEAANAIEHLEAFGLKVNRAKSCVSGFFRESCGMDAYKGISVTPLRFRNVWPSRRTPEALTSWTAYANQMWDAGYYNVYEIIAKQLYSLFGWIPSTDMSLMCPSLRGEPDSCMYARSRSNIPLQKRQWKVWDVQTPRVDKTLNGWKMLLRFFAEATFDSPIRPPWELETQRKGSHLSPRSTGLSYSNEEREPFSVSSYTKRNTMKIVRRWR